MQTDLQKIIDLRESTTHEVIDMLITALHLNIHPGDLDPDTPLFGSGLGLDSVDAVMIVVEIESRYNFSISEEEGKHAVRTVNSIIDLVIRKKYNYPFCTRNVRSHVARACTSKKYLRARGFLIIMYIDQQRNFVVFLYQALKNPLK